MIMRMAIEILIAQTNKEQGKCKSRKTETNHSNRKQNKSQPELKVPLSIIIKNMTKEATQIGL